MALQRRRRESSLQHGACLHGTSFAYLAPAPVVLTSWGLASTSLASRNRQGSTSPAAEATASMRSRAARKLPAEEAGTRQQSRVAGTATTQVQTPSKPHLQPRRGLQHRRAPGCCASNRKAATSQRCSSSRPAGDSSSTCGGKTRTHAWQPRDGWAKGSPCDAQRSCSPAPQQLGPMRLQLGLKHRPPAAVARAGTAPGGPSPAPAHPSPHAESAWPQSRPRRRCRPPQPPQRGWASTACRAPGAPALSSPPAPARCPRPLRAGRWASKQACCCLLQRRDTQGLPLSAQHEVGGHGVWGVGWGVRVCVGGEVCGVRGRGAGRARARGPRACRKEVALQHAAARRVCPSLLPPRPRDLEQLVRGLVFRKPAPTTGAAQLFFHGLPFGAWCHKSGQALQGPKPCPCPKPWP